MGKYEHNQAGKTPLTTARQWQTWDAKGHCSHDWIFMQIGTITRNSFFHFKRKKKGGMSESGMNNKQQNMRWYFWIFWIIFLMLDICNLLILRINNLSILHLRLLNYWTYNLKCFIFYFYFILFLNVFSSTWKAERHRHRERGLPCVSSFPRCLQRPGRGQEESRSMKLCPSLSRSW